MSITVNQELITSVSYGSLGVIDGLTPGRYDVTYEVNNIGAMDAESATAFFNVFIGGKQTNKRFAFQFKYSGSDNILDQAEAALKTYLNS